MPRHHRRVADSRAERPSPTTLGETREPWRGVPFAVRTVSGVGAHRVYRCPGCDQQVVGGPHVVVWPADDFEATDRRHWHRTCWAARERRTPKVQRSRSAPRY